MGVLARDLARAANVTFYTVGDRVRMRVEALVRRQAATRRAVESWNEASVDWLKAAAKVMRGGV